MVLPASVPVMSEEDAAAFMEALQERRRLVYDFLDNWRGSPEFKPDHIHDAIFSYIKRRGKALRPLVLLLSCGAVGGDEKKALPAAAAIEVFHTWTLVHDDVIDRDATRRGSPTVHAEYADQAREAYGLEGEEAAHYGRSVALLAGDSQQSWAYALLCELASGGVDPALVIELVQRMATALTPHLLEGEMLDVQYSLTPPEALSEQQVLDMLNKKTGALLEYAAWCGAKIGLDGQYDKHDYAGKLGRFASLCGTAFQLHDDLLGLVADEGTLGKPVGSDLREGKRTMIVYRALAKSAEADRRLIIAALGNGRASGNEITKALATIRSSGALEEVNDLANQLISQASGLLNSLPETPQRKLLASWAAFLLARTY